MGYGPRLGIRFTLIAVSVRYSCDCRYSYDYRIEIKRIQNVRGRGKTCSSRHDGREGVEGQDAQELILALGLPSGV